MACLSLVEFDEFVDALTDGSRLNLRGTTLTAERLDRVKVACRQRFGLALFDSARLGPDTSFAECVFQKQASFRDATFAGPASFRGASFDAGADLRDTHWHGTADLSATTFEELADLSHATFDGPADFTTIAFNHPDHGLDVSGACFAASATFHRANLTWVNFTGASLAHLRFTEVVHVGRLDLSSTVVTGDADFGGLTPTAVTTLGPFVVGGTVSFDGARLEKTIRILVSATRLHLRDVTFGAGGVLLVRHAETDLDRAVLGGPLTLASREREAGLDEKAIQTHRHRSGRPRLVSLQQVDCENLSLTDVSLVKCRFAGALHLDELRLEGRCPFSPQPKGWWRTRRWVLAEEIVYRSGGSAAWRRLADDLGLTVEPAPTPQRLVSVYRQLRKAEEDVKNEPGAGDFYYAEMEMRRHSRDRSLVERLVLLLYWLISGYGLRAWRSLVTLAVAVLLGSWAFLAWPATPTTPAATTVVNVSVIPPPVAASPAAASVSTAPGASTVLPPTASATTPPPSLLQTTATATRAAPVPTTWPRALQLSVESSLSLLRAPATTVSDRAAWVQLALRLAGPILLALVVLGIRNRVKR